MTQQVFDSQKKRLNQEKNEAIRQIELLQVEIKEELAQKKRTMNDLHRDLHRLEQQRMALGARRIQIETEWSKRISEFELERPNCTSNLADATLQNLFAELRRRGFHGDVHRLSENGEDEVWSLEQSHEE